MVSRVSPSDLPVVGVVADGRTYRNLVYLLLAIPLGFAYSAFFTFGIAFGLVLSVVLVGLVILFATLIGSRLLAGVERWLANALLGTDLRRPDDLDDGGSGALAGVRKYVDAPSTWQGLGFLTLKFWVTLFAFVPIFALVNALPLIAAPLRYPYVATFGESNGEPVTWAIDTLPEAALAVPVGIVGVLIALHVTNAVAYAARQMAIALLGEQPPTGDASSEPRQEKAQDASSPTDESSVRDTSSSTGESAGPDEDSDPESRS
ncbi:sensor domain-containing protein [Halorubrum trueperi]|uniref:Sensor domain-containing protein n=1 Tax=Halorubrum trueperi TaxID=2004704 RepID=A0ABD5UKL8_9EURY